MKTKMEITGSGPLKIQLAQLQHKAEDAAVDVGYTANYAIYVHEAVNTVFKAPGKRAKFLESVVRELAPELFRQVGSDVKRGIPIDKALLKIGFRIQRESQKIVPIDIGNLKASAFTRPVKGTN